MQRDLDNTNEPETRRIAVQAVRGSAYSAAAAAVTLTLGFIRAVLLARLLLPEHFGVVTLAMFYVMLATQLRSFGLDAALIHRQDAGETVRRTYFALRSATLVVSSILLVAAAPLLGWLYPAMPLLSWVVVALVAAEVVCGLSGVQETLLSTELAFGRLAWLDVAASVAMFVTAPLLAWNGWGVWALTAERFSGMLARCAMSWLVFRRWSPRLGWDRTTVRWFWDYGKPSWVSNNLGFVVNRFDDFWIGTVLGPARLGYYSRAYEFAHYPRRAVMNPLVDVLAAVFARLQADRLRLSQVFYRAGYVIVRLAFLVSGAFALVMPEFIELVIGTQWMPMLFTFRLMLIYTLLDAWVLLGSNLLFATGRPDQVQRVTAARAAFFIPAVIVGARLWSINGVALAADGMALVGAAVVYRYVRRKVDFSLFRVAFWPVVAVASGWCGGLMFEAAWHVPGAWMMATGKLAVFAGLYLGLLVATERRRALQGLRWAWENLKRE